MSAKLIMSQLFELVKKGIIPLECFNIYWFYWIHLGEEITQREVAEAIGRRDPKPISKYNKILSRLNLVKFEIQRLQGVMGFKAIPQRLGDDEFKRIIRKSDSDDVNNKNSDDSILPEYLVLAKLLYTEHKKHDENFLSGKNLNSTFKQWAKWIRLLIEKDKRDIELVMRIIKWCQSPGNFWVPNILSGKTLRDKFPTLYGQYMRDGVKGKNVDRYKKIKGKKFKTTDVKGLLNGL